MKSLKKVSDRLSVIRDELFEIAEYRRQRFDAMSDKAKESERGEAMEGRYHTCRTRAWGVA